jgi:general stress protein CsbA
LEKQERVSRGAAWEAGPWPRIIAGFFALVAIVLTLVLFWASDTEGRTSEAAGLLIAIVVCFVIARKARAKIDRGP